MRGSSQNLARCARPLWGCGGWHGGSHVCRFEGAAARRHPSSRLLLLCVGSIALQVLGGQRAGQSLRGTTIGLMEPWPKFDLREIELPATVRVPDGALQTNTARDGSRRGLLRRSTCTKPLAEQVATLNCIAGIFADELDKPLEECRLEGNYRLWRC